MANFRYFIDLPNGETVRVEKAYLNERNTFVGYLDGQWTPISRKVEMKQLPTRHECDDRCLNAKGRASYNRANPGKPGLKPPAPHPKTGKDAARRKSFCARMSAVAKNAKDGERAKASLKRWNCP